MKLSEAHRGKMRHALGLDRKKVSYRNRYFAAVETSDCDLWTELVAAGYAALVKVEGTLALFTVTEAGREALSQSEDSR